MRCLNDLEQFLTFQILHVLSKLQDAKKSPFGLQSRLVIVPECPFNSVITLLLAISQIFILLSSPNENELND